IDSAFDNLLVPQPSWSPSTTQQLRKLVAAPYLPPNDWTPRSEAYFVFPLAQGTPGKQCGLAATGVYQPSLRSPWLAAKEQDCIANHHQGHARVAAVAGSGKTENMIELVWRTVSRGTPPGRILVILFNRDATNDFDVRLTRRFSQEEVNRESLRVRTFHALGKSICELFEKKKLLRNKSLETRGWVMDSMARATLKEAVGRVTNRFQGDSADLKDEFTSFIDIVKADILPAEDVFDKTSVQPTLKSLFLQAFALFEEERERQNIRFF
uniref:UvrD-helicase domain-containing protein n=1 Tax=Thiolapillus sp. TaxID=2017437 RepID=UPI003AF5E93D